MAIVRFPVNQIPFSVFVWSMRRSCCGPPGSKHLGKTYITLCAAWNVELICKTYWIRPVDMMMPIVNIRKVFVTLKDAVEESTLA
jgi:hypothetical protein